MAKELKRPTAIPISRGDDTERLYELESERTEAIKSAATEVGKYLGYGDFWNESMPQALYDTLEAFSPSMVRAVCTAWLEDHPEAEAG